MDELVTPERHAEIRRAAARHAGMMILASVGEWDPREYVRDDAERELLVGEVERIGLEIKARALVGTRRPCPVCGLPFLVRADGMVGRHVGMDAAGFSTGERCPGVGEPPRTS